jgi:hypothetical protein
MSPVHDYRKHAHEARQYAGLLTSAPEKAMWLNIAEQWERMAREADRGHQGGQLAQQPRAVPPKGPHEES